MKSDLKELLLEYIKENGKRDSINDILIDANKQPKDVGLCILLIQEFNINKL
jgi:hypothetical protein